MILTHYKTHLHPHNLTIPLTLLYHILTPSQSYSQIHSIYSPTSHCHTITCSPPHNPPSSASLSNTTPTLTPSQWWGPPGAEYPHPHTITCSHPPTLTVVGSSKGCNISATLSNTTHTLTSSHPHTLTPSHPHSGRALQGLQYLCLAEEHIASTSPPQHTTHILPPSHPHTITPSQWWGPPGAPVSLPGGGTHCLDKPPTTHYSHPPTLPPSHHHTLTVVGSSRGSSISAWRRNTLPRQAPHNTLLTSSHPPTLTPSHPHSGGVLQGLQYLCLAEEHIASTSPPQHTTHILPPSHHHTLTVVGSSMGCSISAWRRNTLPRQALHNTLSNTGILSRAMTPVTKVSLVWVGPATGGGASPSVSGSSSPVWNEDRASVSSTLLSHTVTHLSQDRIPD